MVVIFNLTPVEISQNFGLYHPAEPQWRILFCEDAFRMFAEKCRDVISGCHELSSFILDATFCPPDTSLVAWRNIISSMQYISYRNRNYSSDFWRVLKGDLPPSEFVNNLPQPDCCSPSGSHVKIFKEIHKAKGTEEYAPTINELAFVVDG